MFPSICIGNSEHRCDSWFPMIILAGFERRSQGMTQFILGGCEILWWWRYACDCDSDDRWYFQREFLTFPLFDDASSISFQFPSIEWELILFKFTWTYPCRSMYSFTVEITIVERRSFIRVLVTSFIRLTWVKLNGSDQTTTRRCFCCCCWAGDDWIVETWLTSLALELVRLKKFSRDGENNSLPKISRWPKK